MKQRILVAVVGIPALLAVLCIAPAWATALLLAALTVIAAHELLTAVCGPDKARRWTVLPAVCGVLLLARAVWPGCAALEGLLLAAALTLPLSGVLTYGKPHALTFTDVCAMAAAGFAIPWAFSGLYGLRTLDNGYLLVLTPLVAPSAAMPWPCSPAWPWAVISWPPWSAPTKPWRARQAAWWAAWPAWPFSARCSGP